MRALLRLEVENFRSLRQVAVDLGPVTVLVGPNAAGKTNLLSVIQFLGDSVRKDLTPALEDAGGYDHVRFRGESRGPIRIRVRAVATSYAKESSPDEYELRFSAPIRIRTIRGLDTYALQRKETFTFKRRQGPGRRITISGSKVIVSAPGNQAKTKQLSLREGSLGLSTLPRLGPDEGGEQVAQLGELFSSFRVFDVNVQAAREPRDAREERPLRSNAANLAPFLAYLDREYPDSFARLVTDARQMIPGLKDLQLRRLGGATEAVAVDLLESGLQGPTPLADASYGSIRALALLALLHDPDPPRLTCVEEVDHGLHPYLFDLLVDRLREASAKTQLLLVTHSPALVNRLRPEELIVCERDPETGASIIPAIDPALVRAKEEAAQGRLGLGELWFSGSLRGVP